MKQIITTALVLSGVVAYAQTGNVGINQDTPKATLQIDVASVNANGNNDDNNKTNQGIIIPQLTKQRIADITKANLIDGTMVYAKDFGTITQTDYEIQKRVAQITTKDFYRYNSEIDLWERMSSKRLTKTICKNYTLSEADHNYYISVKSSKDITITVPNLWSGFSCIITQMGTGRVTIEKDRYNIGNVLGSNGLKTRAQYSAIGIVIEDDFNTIVTGDTSTN